MWLKTTIFEQCDRKKIKNSHYELLVQTLSVLREIYCYFIVQVIR